MQTKHQVQQLLASAGVFPNKRFGQNFLIDLNLMQMVVDSANITSDDIVLEVGCGTGSLTEELSAKAGVLVVAEIDNTLIKIAKQQLSDYPNTVFVHGDVLKNKNCLSPTVTDVIELAAKKYKGRFLLVSNLPYCVATPVIINLITGSLKADAMVVTIQKELALRMTAGPLDKLYGVVSIITQATGDVKLIRILKPSVFWPQPEVESAILSYSRDNKKVSRISDLSVFIECINLFMGHRRKQLKACAKFSSDRLSQIKNWSSIFSACDVNPTSRPENLTWQQYVTISNLCSEELELE